MPEQTLRAFGEHGNVERSLDTDLTEAERVLAAEVGLDLGALTSELEHEGVASFCDSDQELLDCIRSKLATLTTV